MKRILISALVLFIALNTIIHVFNETSNDDTMEEAAGVGNLPAVQRACAKGVSQAGLDTALLLAVHGGSNGHAEVVNYLMQHANINAKLHHNGASALDLAIENGSTSMVLALLAAGAKSGVDEPPLHHAALLGRTELVRRLVQLGYPVNMADQNGETALMYAAKSSERENPQLPGLAEFLIKHGADPKVRDREGHTASDIAAAKGNTGLLTLLE